MGSKNNQKLTLTPNPPPHIIGKTVSRLPSHSPSLLDARTRYSKPRVCLPAVHGSASVLHAVVAPGGALVVPSGGGRQLLRRVPRTDRPGESHDHGICCFGCDFTHGSVTYQEGVSFDATSGAAVAKAGTRIKFAFNGVSRVTYDLLRVNQKKTSFVGNASTLADKESSDGVFSICVTSAGTISLRGWGTNSCTQVTAESTITVEAGGTTCAAVGTVKPASGASTSSGSSSSSTTSNPNQAVDTLGSSTTDASATSGKYDTKNCNLSRGSVIKNSDGTSVCECAGDWRNPPACDEYSWTKTILTIGGAVATVLSIVISVRAYAKSRKAKAAANNDDEDNVDIDDRVSEEVLRIDRRSPSKLPPANTPGGSTRTSTVPTVGSVAAARSPARSPNEMPRVKTVRETTL